MKRLHVKYAHECVRAELHINRMYLVLIPLVFSAVSPFRKAKLEGARCTFAILIMLSHCSAAAKPGKYSARGFQLKTYISNKRHIMSTSRREQHEL